MATVRFATREDVPIILELIKELAEYENSLNLCKATTESLLDTIAFAASPSESCPESSVVPISPSRPARTLLLFTPQGLPAGMALFFYNYSTWRSRPGIYLEDLFVKKAERKKGYGLRLLVELAKEVKKMDGGRLEWCVLKSNKPSIEFYQDVVGAKPMMEWQTMRVDGEVLERLAMRLD